MNNNITVAATPGHKTYTDARSGKTSTIDLTLCSNNLIQICETKTLTDHYGSDHTPVKTTIHLTPDKKIKKRRQKWKVDDKKWEAWSTKTTKHLEVEHTTEERTKNVHQITK